MAASVTGIAYVRLQKTTEAEKTGPGKSGIRRARIVPAKRALRQHLSLPLIHYDGVIEPLLAPQAAGNGRLGVLLGNLVRVEAAKRAWPGVTRSTGDVFVAPLTLGIAIGPAVSCRNLN